MSKYVISLKILYLVLSYHSQKTFFVILRWLCHNLSLIHIYTLRTDFDKFMKNLGFDYTPHDYRHAFATRAKEAHLNKSQLLYEEIIKIK